MAYFKPRSDLRDREQDIERIRRVAETISSVCSEVEREIEGLTARHLASSRKANEFLMAFDEQADSRGFQSRLDEVEAAMIYCEKRVSQLQALKEQFSGLLDGASRVVR